MSNQYDGWIREQWVGKERKSMHACVLGELGWKFKSCTWLTPRVDKTFMWTTGAFTLLTSRFLKIATFWSYHLHLREKSRSFSFTKLRDFLVGSAHVRSQATVHAFMHAAHCSMYEGRGYRYTFQRARVASSAEVPKVTWWKIATFLRLAFTLANFAWNFATFQKNRTPACDFSGDVSRVFMRCC